MITFDELCNCAKALEDEDDAIVRIYNNNNFVHITLKNIDTNKKGREYNNLFHIKNFFDWLNANAVSIVHDCLYDQFFFKNCSVKIDLASLLL